MDLRDYRRVMAEKWLLLVVGLVLGVLVAAVLAMLQPPRYTSQTSVHLAVAADDLSGAYNGVRLAREKAVDYAAVAGRGRLASATAPALGPAVDADTLTSALSVSAEPDAPVLTITASATSPQEAQGFARAAGDALIGLVNGLERAPGTVPESSVTARLVQPATVDDRSTSPPVALQLLLGAGVGLALGVVVVLVGHALDASLWSRARAEQAAGTPVLAVVERRRGATRHPWVTDPESPTEVRDAFHHLRTSLAHAPDAPLDGVLVVCSAVAGEGRTTVAINLAAVLAQSGRSVLVVDADLRHPRLHTLLGVEDRDGLGELRADGAPSDDTRRTPAPQTTRAGFDVVTSGPDADDPAMLLGAPAAEAFLEAMRHRYDTVLVDTPPLVAVPDAAAVTHGHHPVLLVVSCRRTTHDDVRRARAGLDAVGVTVVGAVVTFAPEEHRGSRTRPARRSDPTVPPTRPVGDVGEGRAPSAEAATSTAVDTGAGSRQADDDHDTVGVGAPTGERAGHDGEDHPHPS